MRAAAVLVAALAAVAGAVPPPVVPWQEAATRVGETITVEGNVAVARTERDTCILEFAADDPSAFRVVLVVPLLSDLPPEPDRLYAGRKIRASGRVQRFRGRPEMVLQSAARIEVVDVAAAPAGGTAAPPSDAEGSPPEAPAPAMRTAPPDPIAPPAPVEESGATHRLRPRGLVQAVQERIPALESCERARGRWREAAATTRHRVDALTRCLDGDSHDCRDESAAVAPALSTLEGAARQVEAACR